MKISTRLPLAFAVALGLLFAGAMFGIHRLNVAINLFQDDVLHHVAGHKTGAEISSAYAAAIQEWKNVLLRGKEPKDLEKHWAAHQRDMAKVDELLKLLDQQVDDASPEQALVSKLRTEMAAAKDGYLKAFAAYKEADLDLAAGDKAARGKDRAAAETLATLREALSRQEAQATKEAIAGASLATQLAVGVMLLIATVSLAGAIWMSRQITALLSG
jgi:hypothetical protein